MHKHKMLRLSWFGCVCVWYLPLLLFCAAANTTGAGKPGFLSGEKLASGTMNDTIYPSILQVNASTVPVYAGDEITLSCNFDFQKLRELMLTPAGKELSVDHWKFEWLQTHRKSCKNTVEYDYPYVLADSENFATSRFNNRYLRVVFMGNGSDGNFLLRMSGAEPKWHSARYNCRAKPPFLPGERPRGSRFDSRPVDITVLGRREESTRKEVGGHPTSASFSNYGLSEDIKSSTGSSSWMPSAYQESSRTATSAIAVRHGNPSHTNRTSELELQLNNVTPASTVRQAPEQVGTTTIIICSVVGALGLLMVIAACLLYVSWKRSAESHRYTVTSFEPGLGSALTKPKISVQSSTALLPVRAAQATTSKCHEKQRH